MRDNYTLYKLARVLDDSVAAQSFEVNDPAYTLTYPKGIVIRSSTPMFFFLSRATAFSYLADWIHIDCDRALAAVLLECRVESMYYPPEALPHYRCPDLFNPFWKYYYGTDDPKPRDTFTGLVRPPYATAISYMTIVQRQIDIDIDTLFTSAFAVDDD